MEIIKNNTKIKEKFCEMCGLKDTCLCFKCVMYFCDSCFKIIHNMKISNQHKKEKLDLFVPMDIKCPEHPNDRINLFCLDENGNKLIFNIKFNFYRIMLFFMLLFKSS